MFKKASKCLLLASSFFLPGLSSAAEISIDYIADIEYRAEVTLKNRGYTFQYAESHEDELKPVIERARQISTMEDSLIRLVKADVESQLPSSASLSHFELDLDGPYVVKLIGQENGIIQAKVGGFKVNSLAKVNIDPGGIKVGHVDITIRTNTIWFSGDYNVFTGEISNLSAENLNVDINANASSIFDIIPPLSNLIEQEVESQIRTQFQNELHDSLTNGETMVFGLDQALPDRAFVLDNIDLADEIRDGISNLISGEEITISIQEYEKILKTNRSWAQFYPYSSHEININFNDRFFLKVFDKHHIRVKHTDDRICTWYSCPDVPFLQDLPNTAKNPGKLIITEPKPPRNIGKLLPGEHLASIGHYGNYLRSGCSWSQTHGKVRNLTCHGLSIATQLAGKFGQCGLIQMQPGFVMQGDCKSYKISVAGKSPKPVVNFSINKTTVEYGEKITRSYSSSYATKCHGKNGVEIPLHNSAWVTNPLTQSNTFQINCEGPGGKTFSKGVFVKVLPPKPVVNFDIQPRKVKPGQPVKRMYSSQHADKCFGKLGGEIPLNNPAWWTGPRNATHTFQISCEGPGGKTYSKPITVVVEP